MQACFWGSPPVSLSSPQEPGPAMQTGYYNVHQNTLDQRIPQQSSFLQPHSNPVSWTSNQNPVWFTSSNHQGSSSTQVSLRDPSHQAPVPAAQFGNNTENLTNPQFLNSGYQQLVLSKQNATSSATCLASSSENASHQYQKKYTVRDLIQPWDHNASTLQQSWGQQQQPSRTNILYQCHRNVVNKNSTHTPSIPSTQTRSRPMAPPFPLEYTLPSRQRQPSCEGNQTTSHQYFQNDISQSMTNNQYPTVLPQVTVQAQGLPLPYPHHKKSLPNQINTQTPGLHSDITKTSTDSPIHSTSKTNSVSMFRSKLLNFLFKLNPNEIKDLTSSKEKLLQFIRTQVKLSQELTREFGHKRPTSQCVAPRIQSNDKILRIDVEAAKENASVPKQVQAVRPSTVQLDSSQEQVIHHTTTIDKIHFIHLNDSMNLRVENENPERPNMSTINNQSPTPINEGQNETRSGLQFLESSNSDPKVEALANATPSLSEVPAHKLTLENLRDLIRNSNVTCTNEMPTELLNQLYDLYWDRDLKNMKNHVPIIKEVVIQSYEISVKERDAVVLQYLEPSQLNEISQHFHIVKDETSLPPEEFTSSWLNVDEQPADVDGVLAEPIANYVLAANLLQKLPHITESKNYLKNTENISISNSDTVVQSSSQCSSEDFTADNSCSEHERLSAEIVLPEITGTNDTMASKNANANLLLCDAAVTNTFSKSEETLMAVGQQVQADVKIIDDDFKQQLMTENNNVGLDRLNINSSKQNENFEGRISEDELMEVTLLSSENAQTLFQETLQPRNKPNHQQFNLVSNNKFTCPHVKDISSSGLLCSRCWNETPLLELKLDDLVESLEAHDQNQKSLIWLDEPIEDQNSLVCTGIDTQAFELLVDSSGSVPAESDNPKLYETPPVQELHEQINLNSTPAKDTDVIARLAEEANFSTPLSAENNINAKPLSQDKPPQIIVSTPKCSSNIGRQFHKTGATPAVDISISPAIVKKKRKYHRQHHTNHKCDPPAEGKKYSKLQKDNPNEKRSPIKITIRLDEHHTQSGQDSFKMCKKTSAKRQAPNTGTVLCRNSVRPKPKRSYFKKMGNEGSKPTGQNTGGRKVRFELYGSSRQDVGYRNSDNLSSTPVYLAISAKPSTERNYTDMPLAKQKVYNQWRKSFHMHNHKMSSVKTQKAQHHVKAELKSKIQMLKIVLKERVASKEKTIRKKAETQTI